MGKGSDKYDESGTLKGDEYAKRASSSSKSDDENEEQNPLAEKVNEYIKELLSEKVSIDKKYPHADRLLDQEITKTQQTGRIAQRDNRYVDIYREKPVRVTIKVLVPVKEHPKFNFVGKLLGPKGNSMKRLQEETMCKMAVLGRGSMKDRKREEELRASLDPKYLHLNDDLHVEISALAPPAEAHARAAYALAEVRKYLIPDSNDGIRQEQIREMIADGTIPADAEAKPVYKGKISSQIRQPYISRKMNEHSSPAGSMRTVMAPKQKIMSILDRARTAMEESYAAMDEPIYEAAPPPPPPHYETYPYSRSHTAPVSKRSVHYDTCDYEQKSYVCEYYPQREATSYPVKAAIHPSSSRTSWKNSSGNYPSSSHDEPVLKHAHGSHNRESRYRNSPYARPEK